MNRGEATLLKLAAAQRRVQGKISETRRILASKDGDGEGKGLALEELKSVLNRAADGAEWLRSSWLNPHDGYGRLRLPPIILIEEEEEAPRTPMEIAEPALRHPRKEETP